MKADLIGSWAFIIGLIIAIIIAVVAASNVPGWALIVLGILGLIVGLINVTDKEATSFLIASIAFLISFNALASILTTIALGWKAIGTFFYLLSVFVAPATAIVAIKVLYDITREK